MFLIIFSRATFPTILSISEGGIPVPGLLLVKNSLVTFVPFEISNLATKLFLNFSLFSISHLRTVFSNSPNVDSVSLINFIVFFNSLGSSDILWSGPGSLLSSVKCFSYTEIPIAAVATAAIGISVYEKHFTLDNKLPGPDHRMSLEPNELKKTIKLIRETESTLGEFEKTVLKCEIENREKLRKSLVARLDISKGTKVTKEFLTSKRPGTGIPPSEIDKIVGKVALENIIKNTILKKNMFKNNE